MPSKMENMKNLDRMKSMMERGKSKKNSYKSGLEVAGEGLASDEMKESVGNAVKKIGEARKKKKKNAEDSGNRSRR